MLPLVGRSLVEGFGFKGVAATNNVVADKIVDGSSGLGSRGLLQLVLLLLAMSVSDCWWLCLFQQLPKRLCQEKCHARALDAD